MIKSWLNMKNNTPRVVICTNNTLQEDRLSANDSCPIDCCPIISDPKADSKKVIIQPVLEQHKKQNFRQFLRDLREKSNNSGPLLASSEDQSDIADNEGFVVASRHKKNRKSKSTVQMNKENLCESSRLSCDSPDHVVKCKNSKSKNVPDKPTTNLESVFEFLQAKYSKLEKPEFKDLVQKVENENKCSVNTFSNDEIFLKIEELKARLESPPLMSEKRKEGWHAPRVHSAKIIDFNECPICYMPWVEDRIILEECGHSFHSECIRKWMKQKKSCPFCAGFSLLPDEFPPLI